jgi:hypothetical protein
MRRVVAYSACVGVTVAITGCGEPSEEWIAGTSEAVASVSSNIHGYTRSDGMHAMVFTTPTTKHVTELVENPFNSGWPTDLGGVAANDNPWGYKRSDNVDVVMYSDFSRHIHELARVGGSWSDNDFT